jgi:iron complex outermembrane receptor protein
MKYALYLTTSIVALLCGGAVHAQTAQQATQTGSIEEVVVTAERRSENLMKTAISADVLSGDELSSRGVFKVDDLQFIAPSVTVDSFGQGIDFNIRGIGKGEHNSATTAGVITYRDGVATFPGYFAEEPYYDVQSIQVLRGPQGTFVGQNATGGAVFVATNDPVIGGDYNGYGYAQYGNYNDAVLQGAVNIPISDTLAIRIAFDTERRDSFYSIKDRTTNATEGPDNLGNATDPAYFPAYYIAAPDNCPGDKYAGCKHNYNPGDLRWAAGRFSLLWKPTSALTVSFKTDLDYLDNGATIGDAFTDRFPVGKLIPTLPQFGSTPILLANTQHNDPFHVTANAPNVAVDRFVRSILKIDYVFPGGITLRSISGYQKGQTDYSTDLDGSDLGTVANVSLWGQLSNDYTWFDRVNETIYSQELNLISPDNQRVTWVLGAYAQNDRYGFNKPWKLWAGVPYVPQLGSPGLGGQFGAYSIQGAQPATSWAAFGQVMANLVDGLQLQLGGRWSTNRGHNEIQIEQYGTYIQAHEVAKSSSFDYKASLNWTINDNNFAYAFIATGYKPGGLNLPVANGTMAPPFGPEHVTSYETGWKAELADGHLRTTLDAYYNDYKGFQVIVDNPALPNFPTEINAPNTTKIYGLEAEVEAAFGNFSVTSGVGLLHSALGQFYAVDSRLYKTPLACDAATGNPANPYCTSLKGHPQTYAPDFSGNFSAQYIFDLPSGDTITPRVSWAYQSGQWATLFDTKLQGDRLGSRNLLGAQLEWAHAGWVWTLYGTNLTDQHYIVAAESTLDFAGPPRQFGIRLLKTF